MLKKMSQEQKFQQLWEFRRKDDDPDSSSNDSKSSSSGKHILKNHQLVPYWVSPENDEDGDTPTPQQKDLQYAGMVAPIEFGKVNNTPIRAIKKSNRSSKKSNGSSRKSNSVKDKTTLLKSTQEGNKKKKRKQCLEPNSVDDLKVLMESILDELKVERVKMFARMRKEMNKLMVVKTASRPTIKERSCMQKTSQVQHQNNMELGMKPQNCNDGTLDRSVKHGLTTHSQNCHTAIEEKVSYGQGIENIASIGKDDGEGLGFSAKKPIYSFQHSDQAISSPYLAAPCALSEAQIEKRRNESSLRNYSQLGVTGNRTSMTTEKASLLIDANGYFSGIQPDGQFGGFAQSGSKNSGYFDQQVSQTSGFHVPLDPVLENNFCISSQVALGNSTRGSNMIGLRTKVGSIGFTRQIQALPDHVVANSVQNHRNYKADGGLRAFGAQDLKDGHIYPK